MALSHREKIMKQNSMHFNSEKELKQVPLPEILQMHKKITENMNQEK